ncbi:atrial natriuretic peptide receptor 3-like [Ylistrum balloti]|uniref:atrial natriuretic peptide receptor 3-like n=1 Tax=Ylistrum balloti TaxID=509963 RepID=UPI002905B83E|nr:atrial natriuretic peptide receptor 3-like [Ylistrum balloti]
MVEPAIEEAIVEVEKRGLLPFHGLNVTKYNTNCDAIRAPVAAFHFMNDGGHAFFGPVCDYSLAAVARYAPSWDLPVVSPGGLAQDFRDKEKEYQTLTRMGMAFDSMTRFLLAAIAHYRWPKLKLLYDPDGQKEISERFCFLVASAIIKEIKTKRKDMKGDYKQLTKDSSTYAKILREDVGVKYSEKLDTWGPLFSSPEKLDAWGPLFSSPEKLDAWRPLFSSPEKLDAWGPLFQVQRSYMHGGRCFQVQRS